MKHFWIVVLVLLMAGCTQSGVHKTYKVDVVVRDGSQAEFFLGVEADTEAATKSGDAGISPSSALGMQGGTGQVTMGDAQAAAESLWKFFNEQKQETTTNTVEPTPTPTPEPTPEPEEPSLDGYEIAERVEWEGKEVSVDGIKQRKYHFSKSGDQYGSSFMVQWSSGVTLSVSNPKSMKLDPNNAAKYWPREPIPHSGSSWDDTRPGTPAEVYAPRGDSTSSWAQILVKQ